MAATIKLGKLTATINGYKWTCKDAEIEKALNQMLPLYGPSGGDPNPDHTEALRIANILDGELIKYDKVKSEPGVIY